MATLLNSYIRQRQEFLRALSAAATLATVAITLSIAVLLLDGRVLEPGRAALAGLVALLVVGVLRQNARAIALVSPEATGLRLAGLITALQFALAPLAWMLGAPSRGLLRLLGRAAEPSEEDPASELLAVLEAPEDPEAQQSLSEERRMMRGILDLPEQTAREVMRPRIDIVAASTEASIDDVIKLIISSGFSRIPLYEESIDRVVGVLYAKDLLAYLQTGATAPSLLNIARPPYFVPETKRADQLLADLRRDQTHMALVVDEYGGTAGLVTVEDVLEEIVGEIVDEYDTAEVEVERISETEAIVDAPAGESTTSTSCSTRTWRTRTSTRSAGSCSRCSGASRRRATASRARTMASPCRYSPCTAAASGGCGSGTRPPSTRPRPWVPS